MSDADPKVDASPWSMDEEFLGLLVCPETRQPLSVGDDALVARLNEALANGTLRTRAGETLVDPLDGALVRRDGRVAYPVIGRVADLLIDEAIVLSDL